MEAGLLDLVWSVNRSLEVGFMTVTSAYKDLYIRGEMSGEMSGGIVRILF